MKIEHNIILKRTLVLFFVINTFLLSSQEVLSPLSSNHLLHKSIWSKTLTARGSNDTANYLIDYDVLLLPFVDEFSTNKQRPPYKELPTPTSEYYVVGSCVKQLNYKMGTYRFSKQVSTEDTYNPAFPPDYIQTNNQTPILFSLNDTPNCNTLSMQLIYPCSIKRRFSATGQLIWDSLICDTFIYAAHIKNYFLKGYQWTDRHAYINSHLPYMPPSKGVATLDGLNEYGTPYNKEITNAYGLADYLTSAPIDLLNLTGNDSVYLSFLIQPQGLGDYPDVQDSIQVEFLDDRGRWFPVWTKKGTKQELAKDSMSFSFAAIHIPDPVVPSDPFYFHDKFQFRFKNYATISGNNDHWHIDFVRLDKNRNYQDTTLRDANFIYELPSVLKHHTLLPAQQYRGQIDLHDTLRAINRNIYPAPIFSSYKFKCFNENSGLVYGSNVTGIPFAANPLVYHYLLTNTDLNYPNLVEDSTYVTTKIYFDNSDDFKENDTATTRQFFFNEMAYDDGSAEWAYGLQGLGTKKVAYRFFIPNKDTLAAIKVLFSNIDVPVSNLLFNLTLWKKIGMNGQQEEIIKSISNLKPKYLDSLNSFVTFGLDEPLEVQDTIYVGWIQSDERNLQIGYDVNSAKGFDNVFIMTNNVWSKSNIAKSREGSPMIRLILDGVRKYTTSEIVRANNIMDKSRIVFYPNPANEVINFQVGEHKNIDISVFDMLGKLVLHQSLKEGQADISNLNTGLYFIQFSSEGQWLQTDKLQIQR